MGCYDLHQSSTHNNSSSLKKTSMLCVQFNQYEESSHNAELNRTEESHQYTEPYKGNLSILNSKISL